MRTRLGLLGILLVSGCAQGEPIQTASGKPDVVMRGVEAKCVREELMNYSLSTGWDIKASSDIQLVIQRQAPPSFAATMLTSGYGPPYQRLTFNLVPTGKDLRMVIDMAWVSNPNTAFERVQPVRGAQNDQASLEAAASRAESKCAKR